MIGRERIGSVQTSKNLGEVPVEEIGDIDVIRACGMVGAKMPLGVSYWRLKYSGDRREIFHVLAGCTELLAKRGVENADQLAKRVLKHLLDDICHTCHGRGFELIAGTPMLSDNACPVCNGEGRIRYPDENESALWLIETIARMEREVAAAIMKKLNAEMEF